MWVYLGHEVLVTLRSGDSVRGRLSWSWALGFWRVTGVSALSEDGTAHEMAGSALIPKSSIAIAQVI